MCLSTLRNQTSHRTNLPLPPVEEVEKRLKVKVKNGKVVLWKIYTESVKINDRGIQVPCLRSPYVYLDGVISNRGFIRSNRESKKLTERETIHCIVENGIHVFLTRKDCRAKVKTKNDNKWDGAHYSVFKVECSMRDLVGVGYSFGEIPSAVFMKVKPVDPRFETFGIR